MARGKDDAPLLDRPHAARRAAKARTGAAAHLDEHQRAIALAHDEVDLAAAAPGRSIIALHQHQTRAQQVRERGIFRLLAAHTRGGHRPACVFTAKDSH